MGETWKLLPFRLLREMSELKTKNVRLFLQFLHVFSHGEEDIRTLHQDLLVFEYWTGSLNLYKIIPFPMTTRLFS